MIRHNHLESFIFEIFKVNYEMLYCFGNHCHYSFNRTDLYDKLTPKFLKIETQNKIDNRNIQGNLIDNTIPVDRSGESDSMKTTKKVDFISTSLGGEWSPLKLYYDICMICICLITYVYIYMYIHI
jgi:hypothetical protein